MEQTREELKERIRKELFYGYEVFGSDEIDCCTTDMVADFILAREQSLKERQG